MKWPSMFGCLPRGHVETLPWFGWSNGNLKETLQWDLTRFTSGKLRMQIWKLTRKKLSEMVEVRLVWGWFWLIIQWRCWENGPIRWITRKKTTLHPSFFIKSKHHLKFWWFGDCACGFLDERSIDETLMFVHHGTMAGWKGRKSRREGEPQWYREGGEPVGDS